MPDATVLCGYNRVESVTWFYRTTNKSQGPGRSPRPLAQERWVCRSLGTVVSPGCSPRPVDGVPVLTCYNLWGQSPGLGATTLNKASGKHDKACHHL